MSSTGLYRSPATADKAQASQNRPASNATTAGSPQKEMKTSMNSMGTIETQSGDVPLARFGHTTTYVGEYTVLLFGGAVGDSGRYQITNDIYMLNLSTMRWTSVKSENNPSPRAAHAAACVDTMQFVVYGGATGGGTLSTDELYLLDLRKQSQGASWMLVPLTGGTPKRRYGHSMAYHKPNLIVFGGNDGNGSLNDVWFMDVEQPPFHWKMVVLSAGSKQPPPRVYHSADICREGPANGMMVVFGGRTTDSKSLRDAWGLRQHRDGRWDWVEAPAKKGSPPDPRFQHTSLFLGSKMVIIGGRDTELARPLGTALYDTETCEWRSLQSMARFRHSSWGLNSVVFTFGGFDHRTQSHPTSDLQSLDISLLSDPAVSQAAPSSPVPVRSRTGSSGSSANALSTTPSHPPVSSPPSGSPAPERTTSSLSPRFDFPKRPPSGGSPGRPGRAAYTKSAEKVRLSTHVHTKIDSPHNPDFSALVRKISIDRLAEESKKIKGHGGVMTLHSVAEGDESAADSVIKKLLKPNITPLLIDRDYNGQGPFCLSWDTVSALCQSVLRVMKSEDMVLRLRAPIKVYGDIHGQYYDLMRLFGSYKCPVSEDWFDDQDGGPCDGDMQGDLDSMDYLFLGDFVDRGTNSLEVICLLFALKLRYPLQVHLIRGNHEDAAINSVYGFKEECKRRLREDPDHADSCWEKFNRVFEWLPVGGIVEDRILCIHGGIGGSIHEVENLSELKRPLKVIQTPTTDLDQIVTDLLWSDPADTDSMRGVMPNDTRDPDGAGHIVKFGPDRVVSFLQHNKLDLIVRAHECVMDGFERFAGGRLITLFSATDYCGNHKNAGALLFIRRDLTVVPKIIYPADTDYRSTWISLESRPATPPRSQRRIRDRDLGFA